VSHANGGNAGVPLASTWSEETRSAALEQLERIVGSPHFRTSKRCSHFLRYVIEHAGSDPVELKERTLGVEVFNRGAQYDTHQDPVVRVTAGEVRKRLAQYYLEPGHETELRITLPAGSYVPEFHPPLHPPEPLQITAPQTGKPTDAQVALVVLKPRRERWILAAVTIAVAAVAIFLLVRGGKTELDSFWAPVLDPAGPVLVCLGQPNTYHFQTRTQADLDRWFGTSPEGKVAPENLQKVPLAEIVPSWDRYVSIHDAESFARLSTLFARSGKQAMIRGGRSVSLSDLRGRPVVLIGAFNNEWTLSLGRELRFYFDREPGHGEVVRDRQNPKNLDWTAAPSWPHRRIPMDYAVVTRLLSPVTEQTVVVVAGLTHFGTQAAGEFVTNPAYFAEAIKNAPRDWRQRNMQVVLSAKVMSGTVGPPSVLAAHFW
jgi:hypothetical protein